MKYPNLNEEKKLWKKGYKYVVGLDEAGRGCLAGPVVACAVLINPKFEIRPQPIFNGLGRPAQNFGLWQNPKQIRNPKFKCSKRFGIWKIGKFEFVSDFVLRASNLKIKDSKKLSAKKREELYKILTKNPAIEWAIGRVSEKVIDKINILEATKLAMKRAIKNLEKKLKSSSLFHDREKMGKINFLILDGNFKLDLPIPQKSIIKADEKVFSCCLASIIAKVTRDRIMERYHKKYPSYCFHKHKGYSTNFHIKILKKYGPCSIHRQSFGILKSPKFKNIRKQQTFR